MSKALASTDRLSESGISSVLDASNSNARLGSPASRALCAAESAELIGVLLPLDARVALASRTRSVPPGDADTFERAAMLNSNINATTLMVVGMQ